MWSDDQREFYGWLNFYHNFYEMVSSQWTVTEVELGQTWMAEYDILVDAFFVWYERQRKKKQEERRREQSSGVNFKDHEIVMEAAHI